MESVKFFCPSCRQKLEAEAEMFGTKLQCPVCNAWMLVPNGVTPAVPSAGSAPDGPPLPPADAGKVARPRYMLALCIGGGIGVVVLAGFLVAAWWLGTMSRKNDMDLSALPEWTPQVASSAIQSVSVPQIIEEEPRDKVVDLPPPAGGEGPSRRMDGEKGDSSSREVVPEPGRANTVAESPRRPERDLSAEERKSVFLQLLAADDRAQQDAKRQFPDDPTHGMAAGDKLKLRDRVPVYRTPPPPDAPQAELDEAGKLQPGVEIEVTEVRAGRTLPWYSVQATDKTGNPAGKGWVSAAALTGQSREDMNARHRKQENLRGELLSQYQRDVEVKHGIGTPQARKIYSEGIENGWDGSKRGDITGD